MEIYLILRHINFAKGLKIISTHEVKVIKINHIDPHPNGDFLELIKIWDYVCVVRKGQFKVGDLAAYIEPDYIVDTNRPEFSFLAKRNEENNELIHILKRITVKRFRGIWSQGLLIPAPSNSQEGDNVINLLGIARWEPKETKLIKGGNFPSKGPKINPPKYDLENLRKWGKLLIPREEVICTVKLHGCNARYVWSEEMFCGSRTTWKKQPGYYFKTPPKSLFKKLIYFFLKKFFSPEKVFNFFTKVSFQFIRKEIINFVYKVPNNAWWEALKQNEWIENWCKQNPNVVLYGEIIGPSIQGNKHHYGYKTNELGVRIFDILEDNNWVPNTKFTLEKYKNIKFVPTVYKGPYDISIIENFAEQKENFNNANHIREGIVVKVVNERIHPKIGRVALKYISNTYLSQK